MKFNFEKASPAEAPGETDPRELLPEAAERKERIMGAFSERRRQLLKDVFTSRSADLIGNFIPGIDIPKMVTEAIVGKTISGEKLSRRKKFDLIAISGGISVAYALECVGMPIEALTVRSVAAALSKIEFGPEFLEEIAEKTKAKYPKTSELLGKTEEFLSDKREQTVAYARSVKEAFRVAATQTAY